MPGLSSPVPPSASDPSRGKTALSRPDAIAAGFRPAPRFAVARSASETTVCRSVIHRIHPRRRRSIARPERTAPGFRCNPPAETARAGRLRPTRTSRDPLCLRIRAVVHEALAVRRTGIETGRSRCRSSAAFRPRRSRWSGCRGDQKRLAALSVPASGCADSEARPRIQSRCTIPAMDRERLPRDLAGFAGRSRRSRAGTSDLKLHSRFAVWRTRDDCHRGLNRGRSSPSR
jgi:hypothetical protein